MTAMTDRYENIRRALANGPTPGPWEPSYDKGSTRDSSNITDKQVGGRFMKDGSGKVIKPDGWQPSDFDRFFGAADSEGGEVGATPGRCVRRPIQRGPI